MRVGAARAGALSLALTALALVPAAAPALVPAAARGADVFALPSQADASESAGNRLDLRAVTFAQSGTQFWFKVRTAGVWRPEDLAADSICVVANRGGEARRICVAARGPDPVLLVARSEPEAARADAWSTPRILPATITRANGRSLSASFAPRELGLPYGALRWRVATHSSAGPACAPGCSDAAPDRGRFRSELSAFGAPRCFGAAARATRNCRNPLLRRLVFPSPANAEWMPDSTCQPSRGSRRYQVIRPCEFGDVSDSQPPRVALIGDSHSGHLRAAVDVFAQALGWRAVSITRPGCAFSTEAYPAPPPIPARCRMHTAEALSWLRAHPSVTTVFTSNAAGRGLGPGGFVAAWSQAPRTVRRIYEIRDVPRVSYATASCVLGVMRRHEPSDGACSVPRGGAFPFDAAAAAASGAGSRVALIDLTRYFCDSARCFPVIGGAYVYKDFNHLNRVFAQTLGPALLRATALRPGP